MSRIAWFSPISLESGLRSAHYSHTILAQAPQDWDVEIFVDAEEYARLTSTQQHLFGFPVYLHHQHFLRHRVSPFDVTIFHVEDRPETAFAKRAAALRPGMVFVHDLNLSRLELGVEGYSKNGVLLEERLKERFGDDVLPLGEYQARGWSFDVFDNQYAHVNLEYHPDSLLIAENERSVAELANRAAAHVALSATPIRAVQPGAVAEARRLHRSRLGISNQENVIGFGGRYVTEDRIGVMLEAFLEISNSHKATLLWLVPDAEAEIRAKSLLARYQNLGLHPEQVKLVLVDEANAVSSLMCIPDVMVSLKFDALRGIPLLALLAMARGIPTLMSFFGPSAEIPTGAVAQINVGSGEKQMLRETLLRVFADGEFRESLSQGGREYAETVSDPAAVLEDLKVLIAQEKTRLEQAQHSFDTELQSARDNGLRQAEQRLQKRVGGISWSARFSLSAEGIFDGRSTPPK